MICQEQEILTEKSGIVEGVEVGAKEYVVVGGDKQRTMRFVCTVCAHPVTLSTRSHKPLFVKLLREACYGNSNLQNLVPK